MKALARIAPALVATVLVAPAMASEPADAGKTIGNATVQSDRGIDTATRALQARYPARPAEFHADGSISQYIGARHLMQTVVRIGDDGKLEELCTTDKEAARQFMTAAADARSANDAGEEQ